MGNQTLILSNVQTFDESNPNNFQILLTSPDFYPLLTKKSTLNIYYDFQYGPSTNFLSGPRITSSVINQCKIGDKLIDKNDGKCVQLIDYKGGNYLGGWYKISGKEIIQGSGNGWTECDDEEQIIPCQKRDCGYSDWDDGICLKTDELDANGDYVWKRLQTRTIINEAEAGGVACNPATLTQQIYTCPPVNCQQDSNIIDLIQDRHYDSLTGNFVKTFQNHIITQPAYGGQNCSLPSFDIVVGP